MSSERVDSDEKTTGQSGPGKGAPSTGSDVQRQARTAAQQREADASKDPEVLAKQIEETREDLAETLDAIATEAAKHPAAHPALFTTSSETGSGIAELRTAILKAATA